LRAPSVRLLRQLSVLFSSLVFLGALAAAFWHPSTLAKPALTAKVTIENYTFMPHVLRVHAGATVTWTNLDTNVGHTVTSGNGTDTRRWRSSPLFFGGQRFSVTFRKPGTYLYYCMPHYYNPAMHGVIVVSR
jgi:plastocyanin